MGTMIEVVVVPPPTRVGRRERDCASSLPERLIVLGADPSPDAPVAVVGAACTREGRERGESERGCAADIGKRA